ALLLRSVNPSEWHSPAARRLAYHDVSQKRRAQTQGAADQAVHPDPEEAPPFGFSRKDESAGRAEARKAVAPLTADAGEKSHCIVPALHERLGGRDRLSAGGFDQRGSRNTTGLPRVQERSQA